MILYFCGCYEKRHSELLKNLLWKQINNPAATSMDPLSVTLKLVHYWANILEVLVLYHSWLRLKFPAGDLCSEILKTWVETFSELSFHRYLICLGSEDSSCLLLSPTLLFFLGLFLSKFLILLNLLLGAPMLAEYLIIWFIHGMVYYVRYFHLY